MRITRFHDIGSPIPIFAEITEEFSMPINHLSKVMGKLTRTGWYMLYGAAMAGTYQALIRKRCTLKQCFVNWNAIPN